MNCGDNVAKAVAVVIPLKSEADCRFPPRNAAKVTATDRAVANPSPVTTRDRGQGICLGSFREGAAAAGRAARDGSLGVAH
jgi:hypothetical protein